MSAAVWTPEATALRCPRCGSGPGSRCQTDSGNRASAPHRGRLVPSFTCPSCALVTTEPTNVASGYCTRCQAWTGPQATSRYVAAAQDELAL